MRPLPTKTKRILLLGGVVLGIGFLTAVWWNIREPRIEGRPLRFWLEAMGDVSNQPTVETQQATEMIRSNGRDALPALRRMLKARDSLFTECLWKILSKQTLVQNLSRDSDSEYKRHLACRGLWALGEFAEPAIPDLEKDLHENQCSAAPIVLAHIGPKAFPVLTRALTNSDTRIRIRGFIGFYTQSTHLQSAIPFLSTLLIAETNSRAQFLAAIVLGKTGQRGDLVVPVLLDAIASSNADLQVMALSEFANYPDQARLHLEQLQQLVGEPANVGATARETLKRIAPELVPKD